MNNEIKTPALDMLTTKISRFTVVVIIVRTEGLQ